MAKLAQNVKEILDIFSSNTENVTSFLSAQPELYEKFKSSLKKVYDISKKTENVHEQSNIALKRLIVDNFDTEQIWQQIELQNKLINKDLNSRLTEYISNNNVIPSEDEESDGQESNDTESESEDVAASSEDDDSNDDTDENDLNLDEEDSIEEDEDEGMDEDNEDAKSEESIDYFQDIPSDDEDTGDKKKNKNKYGPMYSDFFDEPGENQNDPNSSNKRVRFDLDDMDEEEEEAKATELDTNQVKSSFEERQERLRQKVEKLEEEALSEKPWHLMGEASAKTRPANSLLEHNLEFDLTVRPAPIITEEVALKLEDIIIQRIKDAAWDDVERKIKPVDTPFEFKKKLVLNQEKSKLSLAQIYEQEYLKRVEAANPDNNEQKEEPKEHQHIKALLNNLFRKLDALSNYHYTPRPAMPELKIVSNLPAVSMEEAIPTTVSDAALLAPEEIQVKKKGGLVGKDERSGTDMKRDRRRKKLRQRQKRKEVEKREAYLKRLKPGLGNKYSKEKVKKELEELSKKGAVSKFQEDSDTRKSSKSSKQFFDRLQDTISSNNNVKAVKKQKNDSKIKAVRIKL